jgi:adenylate cyclase
LVNHADLEEDFPFWLYLFYDLVSIIIAALIGGFIMIFFLEDWFRKRPYGQAMFFVFVLYSITSIIISYLGFSLLYKNEMRVSFFSSEVQDKVQGYLWSLDYFKNYSLWLIITFISIAALLINDKYGPGVLKDFLLGKYFHPTREERIFMFLDLRSSTQIAEILGEAQYFNFLKDLFREATPPILNSRGEIYQYVGDEIVITWKMDRGLKDAACIRCFFDIQELLLKRSPYYLKKYGFKPEFKAGIHYGHVMTGEIGVIKRDIIFSGDVLNTAARIQGKCNDFGVDLLLSKHIIEKLSLPPNALQPEKMGELHLRGKQKRISLYTIN